MNVAARSDYRRGTTTTGTGLGLPLAQQIVSAHNGTIAYKSDPGHGANV
jgi:signal transduction histidine kinase